MMDEALGHHAAASRGYAGTVADSRRVDDEDAES
ncbi:hypothetical protein PBI_ANDREW_66 [Arthrobacter phage Andrew]|uniref:Uncharacterized protein n=1 Tax=Arthrobacter phage Andrew TaxID=2419946 RepID=A0A3G2KD09_9CAUD|nr:hypothetical protein HOU53_gp66 [Arthrobacter phage Andrew]AYN56888.1 hypothetical protein PBI_ANDREW_66 [Arthrobacter phage Andrew]